MGYTQADLDRVRAAMTSGVREISVGGRRKVYQSITELQALERVIERHLADAAQPARPRRRTSGTLMTRPF